VAEHRYQAVLTVISEGLSVSQVAQEVGVSRQTLHAWLGSPRTVCAKCRHRGRLGPWCVVAID
jgi:transposase